MVEYAGPKSQNWTVGRGSEQFGTVLDNLLTIYQEDKILLDAASRKLPWSKIAALLPGRTDSRVGGNSFSFQPGRGQLMTFTVLKAISDAD